jgi:hypothetical protein
MLLHADARAIVGSALVLAIDPLGYSAALGAANRLNDWVSAGSRMAENSAGAVLSS